MSSPKPPGPDAGLVKRQKSLLDLQIGELQNREELAALQRAEANIGLAKRSRRSLFSLFGGQTKAGGLLNGNSARSMFGSGIKLGGMS